MLARISVNAILFAIGIVSDFARNYRKVMGIMGTNVRAYKVVGGCDSCCGRTLHVSTWKEGIHRENKAIVFLIR